MEIALFSALVMNKLKDGSQSVDYCFGLTTILVTTLPLLMYVSDALGLGVSGKSLAIFGAAVLLPTVAIAALRPEVRSFPSVELRGLAAPAFVVLVSTAIGFGPMWPSFYPTSLGDTGHHYLYAMYIFRYSSLPHSSSEFYPGIFHGLSGGWNYPQGMHILVVLLSEAIGAPVIVLLQSVVVFGAVVIALAVYRISTHFGSNKTSVIGALVSFVGAPLALSTSAGSFTTVWGILFVCVTLLFLVSFERDPSYKQLILVAFSAVGLGLYYPLYAPLVLLGVAIGAFQVAEKRKALAASLLTAGACALGIAQYVFFQKRGTAGPDLVTSYRSTDLNARMIAGVYAAALENAAFVATWLAVFAAILISARKFYVNRGEARPTLLAVTLTLTLASLTSFFGILFLYPGVINCMPACRGFYVPGYSLGLHFGLALIILLGYLAFRHNKRSVFLLSFLALTFVFLVGYDSVGNLYYSSKHYFIISTLAPVLFGAVVHWAQSTIGSPRIIAKRNLYSIPRSKILALVLLIAIATNLLAQTAVVARQQVSLRPAVYPGELAAGEWLRTNAGKAFPCDNYEYFVTMSDLRAWFFEIASERGFNMNKLPEDWSLPPYPVSYTLLEWIHFARRGDILIADRSFPDAVPSYISFEPGGTVFVDGKYVEVIHISDPVIILRYLGDNPNSTETGDTCVAGWSYLG
jgi:hypothetical protein